MDSMICLTRAEIHYSTDNSEAYKGITDLWNLTLAFDEEQEKLTPEDVEAVAREVERAYSRPPFVRPDEPDGGSTI